jgi:hypothetical protein
VLSLDQALAEPGVYELSDKEYFGRALASTTLSSTGVREILVCPAKFRHNQQNPRPPKRTFDVGHAAHQLVLGAGPPLVRIDADEWRSKAVKEEVAEVRAAGGVPLKPADFEAVHMMADRIREDRQAMWLLRLGAPERTLIWVDDETGVTCRAKADWLRHDGIVDYKTTDNADPAGLPRTIHNYGYAIQAAFYLRGFRARQPGVEPFFAFITQEKDPPYLTLPFQLSDRALAYGDSKCAEALRRYRDCTEADIWPGYEHAIEDPIDLPAWVQTEEW